MGTKTSKDGTKYTGKWRDGNPHGQGKIKYKDGSHYKGEWRDGQPHGEGRKFNARDKSTYEGEWEYGVAAGRGIKTIDGNKFSGLWVRNELLKGEVVYQNGNKYKGHLKCSKPNGPGSMYWQDTKQYYEGDFFNGKPTGKGVSIQKDNKNQATQSAEKQTEGSWSDNKFVKGNPSAEDQEKEKAMLKMNEAKENKNKDEVRR